MQQEAETAFYELAIITLQISAKHHWLKIF